MPEMLTEVMTGRVDFSFSTIAAALPFIRDGKLLALAVSTPKRSAALPDVPTTLEPATPIPTTRSGTGCSAGEDAARDRREAAPETQKAAQLAGHRWRSSRAGHRSDADHAPRSSTRRSRRRSREHRAGQGGRRPRVNSGA